MAENNKSICAIITARGGSKGLPRKNVLPILKLPLIAYSIKAAQDCQDISDVYVTTDCSEIKAVSKQFGAKVIDRPAALATDTASSYDAVAHCLLTLKEQGKEYDNFVLLQPTSPLRNSRHVSEAINLFFENDAQSCISFCEAEHHPYKDFIQDSDGFRPVSKLEYISMPRQELPKAYRQNGAIYILNCDGFLNGNESFMLNPMCPYLMSREDSVDIDSKDDLESAELFLLKKMKK